MSKGIYKNDISGTGAERHGGRWNNKGTKMLYTSASRALAMVEVAVNLPLSILPKDYFMVTIEIPDIAMDLIKLGSIKGKNWRTHPPSGITQAMGGFICY